MESKPKRICFVTTVSITLKAFVVETAKYLHEQGGYDISMICSPDEAFEKSLPEYIRFIPVPMERGISLGGFKALGQMRRIFKREKFDLVQYSTPNASCYAAIAAKQAKIPVRLYCQWGIAYVGFQGIKRRIFKAIEKTVCRLSTHVEPDSNGNLIFSQAEGLYGGEKGHVVWNGSACGVSLEKFDIARKPVWRDAIRQKLGIPQNDFVFGFIGRFTRDKGVGELLAAAKTVLADRPDAWLIFVGGKESEENVFPELIAWAEGHDRVIFCGTTNVVEQYVSAMDVYVLPSYREGFGMAVVEAEAMAVPVIVTDIPGPTDAMEPGKTGLLVQKKDVATLADAMSRLYADAPLCQSMGEAARYLAAEKFEQKQLLVHILEDRNRLLQKDKL